LASKIYTRYEHIIDLQVAGYSNYWKMNKVVISVAVLFAVNRIIETFL